MACRFPGAPDPDAFWDVLSGGVDAVREIPDDRFDIDEFYDPDPETPGKIYTRCGGYLDGIDGFDPEFFGISPREAVWIDPQQRLMLEIAWEGLERAGYSPASLRGSRSGVFVGVAANEYSHLLSSDSVESIEAHFITGNALNAISGRVAFALGLEGPAVAVDTACSSSLVAVHQACQALHSGDCDLALAGGVNVLLSPASIVAASRARMLSPDGRCKTFDAAADGYVRSEGCGILVLKRLSDAQRDGDRIRAVIRGTAVNQDGASSGLTVPNGGAQQRLIAAALARAGIGGADIDYLEAHGTGTALGDPIEVQAAAAVYGADRDPNRPLLMGSVKTNIGHLESAAGVAGLVKVVLSLQNEVLPKNLHFEKPSPHIPWDSLPVQVVDKATPWRTNGRPTPRRRQFVRVHRHERARAHRGGATAIGDRGRELGRHGLTRCHRGTGVGRPTGIGQCAALVRAISRRAGGDGAAIWRLAGCALGRRRSPMCASLPAQGVRISNTGARWSWIRSGSARASRRVGREPAAPGRGTWRVRGSADDGMVVHRAGQPVRRDGARIVRHRAGVRRHRDAVRRSRRSDTAAPLLEVLFGTDSDSAETLRHTSLRSPRSSPSRWAWPGCGSRGASNPTWFWGTAWVSTPRRVWPKCSASRTGHG